MPAQTQPSRRAARPLAGPVAHPWLAPILLAAALCITACGAISTRGAASPLPGGGLTSAAYTGGASSAQNVIPTPQTAVQPLTVAATNGILADMAQNVGGDLVAVTTLVPDGFDPHSFQPTPGISLAVKDAGLVVSNGASLDAFLDNLIKNALNPTAVWVVASEGLAAEEDRDSADHPEEHEAVDPHYWQDPRQALHYVEQILAGLVQADPANRARYTANAEAYNNQILVLDLEIIEALSSVPEDQRIIVTFHNSFGHFARRYGWETKALVSSHGGDPAPADVTNLVESARERRIGAVFAEPQFDSRVLNIAAKELGVDVALLYSDSLDAEVSSYIEMMHFNANSLSENLTP